MTHQPSPRDPSAARVDGDLAHVDAMTNSLVRVAKLLRNLRGQLPRPHANIDPVSYPILFALSHAPMRVSELAETVHSDISTISRQVSALSANGLIRKTADPEDGRAQVLSLSDQAIELLAQLREHRARIFAGYLEGWDRAEVDAFTGYLDRLGQAIAESAPGTAGLVRHESADLGDRAGEAAGQQS